MKVSFASVIQYVSVWLFITLKHTMLVYALECKFTDDLLAAEVPKLFERDSNLSLMNYW